MIEKQIIALCLRKEFWEKAREAGDLIAGKEDKKYFDEDFEAEPWFGY